MKRLNLFWFWLDDDADVKITRGGAQADASSRLCAW